ncbi:MAG TPA: L-aspartate oxidase [Terriglobia bacterium]|nr:L-aspartate oxidase [Terriglobia bacterium]
MSNSGNPSSLEADFLIIGSGVAGLYAALIAAPHGQVLLVTKASFQKSNSFEAQGGIAAAVAADDSPSLHMEDTIRAGRGLCNRPAVEILTREAPRVIEHLAALGVAFDRDAGGAWELGQEGGHSRRRILHAAGSATGQSIVAALSDRVRENPHVRLLEHTAAVELLAAQGRCCGAWAYHRNSEQFLLLSAGATILATGGAAALYQRTTNPASATGEGIALAYRAGAEVADLEFMQFHPTALCLEGKSSFLLSEALRGEGAVLRDSEGRRFLPEYHELAELAPRDVVAAAIHAELQRSGARCVYLDARSLGAEFLRRRFSNIYEACLAQGLDMARQPIPVAPAAHYTIGGVRTGLDGKTSVPGLWACGETACTGVHGANRLASNSLLECFVFARRAAESAAREGGAAGRAPLAAAARWSPQPCAREEWEPFARLLTQQVGLVRESEGLRQALKEFCAQSPDPGAACERSDRLLLARLMAQAALLREESRGAHRRRDFPNPEPRWQTHIVFQKGREPALVCS